jgi:V8-like Glu-specific endopeptidase
MKIFKTILALSVFAAAYAVLSPRPERIPADLRDAPGPSGALEELPGNEWAPAAPEVAPDRAEPLAGKSIYGEDDRIEYYAASADRRALADSVVSLWSSRWVRPELGKANLFTTTLRAAADLCPGERFAEQPTGAFCSGTLVGEDLVLTAGHCITGEAKCSDTKFVFGFGLKKAGDYPRSVPEGEVYGCKRIVKRALTTGPVASIYHNLLDGGPGPDYAVVQLDRKVAGHKPLAIERGKDAAPGTPLFVIGHPVGIPVKIAGNAKVRSAEATYFFLADLDTFGGNSGSAVFNARTNRIEGVLVRGGRDFAPSPAGCNVHYVLPQDAGKGESVTKISAVEKYIP